MKLKKIVAAVCAAAMTVSAVALTPMFSNAAEFGSADGSWTQDVFCNNDSAEFAGVDVTSVTSVVFNATANDLNYGWNNGKFTSNSDGGWKDVSFGGNMSDAQVVLEDTGAFNVEVECTPTGGYFELGWGTGCGEGAFTLDSIDFMTADGKLGTWTDGVWAAASADEPVYDVVWETVSDGVYKLVDKDAEDKTLYLDLLDANTPEIAASIRSISVDVDGTGSNGCIGTNVLDENGVADWAKAGWADSQRVTLETPNGVEFNEETGYATLQVQVWWLGGDITVSNIEYVWEGEEPAPEEPGNTIVLWEGSKDLGTDWGSNVRTSVAEDKVKAGDTIKITYEAGTAADYQQIKLMQGADGWPVLTSVQVSEWGTVDLDAASTVFTFVINADDAAAIIANNIIISGYNVTIKSIEVIPAKTETEDPSDPETPTTPSSSSNPLAGNCTIMPVYSINLASSDNAAAIKQLKDGDVYEYPISESNPVIKRRFLQSIMGRDITIKFTYRGIDFHFNGKDVKVPHTVNMRTVYEMYYADKEAE